MRLLITRPLPENVVDAVHALALEVVVREETVPLAADALRASLRDFDIVLPTLGDAYSADVFADVRDPRCRLLANFGVGYNHIDVDAAGRAGVTVTNTPGAVTDATADIAVMLMLMSARRASEGERMVRAGRWDGWHPTQMLGLHMTGKTVGIVGMGRIGQAIAHRCHFGFGMHVRFVNRSERHIAFAEQMESLDALARTVDFLVVAVPGGPETQKLIDANVLSAMQAHAHLINVARGDVVDETALEEALIARQIGGAGLDVYAREPDMSDRLRSLDTVTLLPHLGTAAQEVREDMGHMAVANIAAFLRGAPVPNPV